MLVNRVGRRLVSRLHLETLLVAAGSYRQWPPEGPVRSTLFLLRVGIVLEWREDPGLGDTHSEPGSYCVTS